MGLLSESVKKWSTFPEKHDTHHSLSISLTLPCFMGILYKKVIS